MMGGSIFIEAAFSSFLFSFLLLHLDTTVALVRVVLRGQGSYIPRSQLKVLDIQLMSFVPLCTVCCCGVV
jgi:hypothetical protein